MKINPAIMLVAVTVFATSCEMFETRALKNNVIGLFEEHKISVGELVCQSNLNERSGACLFSAERENVSVLIERLNLKKSSLSAQEKIEECKKSSLSRENADVETFVKAEKLNLKNGQAFEKFNLFYNPQTREGCVQIQYSYG